MTNLDPARYEQQLQQKLTTLRTNFADLQMPDIEVFRSEPLNFRMRAEFRIWHDGEDSHYAMHNPGGSRPFPITEFPIGSKRIADLMPTLMANIRGNQQLRRKLYVVEFLTTLSGDALVTLIYHKRLDDNWEAEARGLMTALGCPVIGRSRKQKVVLDRDYVMEELQVLDRRYRYKQVETGFTQPNAGINQKMLEWAATVTGTSHHVPQGDLLELYCGNGNFTVPLAQNFDKVLATEIAKISVNSAHHNLQVNAIDNVTIVRMSSEEFTDALNKVRPFRRLQNIDLESYHFSTVFVDPPRAGLDNGTLELIKQFDQILYISCNPNTLRTNLEALSDSHSIEKFAVFDQFPYTHHVECGALLQRR